MDWTGCMYVLNSIEAKLNHAGQGRKARKRQGFTNGEGRA